MGAPYTRVHRVVLVCGVFYMLDGDNGVMMAARHCVKEFVKAESVVAAVRMI